jgi:hypothetical protein
MVRTRCRFGVCGVFDLREAGYHASKVATIIKHLLTAAQPMHDLYGTPSVAFRESPAAHGTTDAPDVAFVAQSSIALRFSEARSVSVAGRTILPVWVVVDLALERSEEIT